MIKISPENEGTLKFLNKLSSKDNIEYEVIFGSKGKQHKHLSNKINYEKFLNLLKKCKYNAAIYKLIGKTNELDIFIHKNNDVNDNGKLLPFRITLDGDNISRFCQSNTIENLKYKMIYKTPLYLNNIMTRDEISELPEKIKNLKKLKVDLEDYGLRFNFKKELVLEGNNFRDRFAREKYNEFLNLQREKTFQNLYKTFRLKNRYSFKFERHRLDITIISESKKILDSNGNLQQLPVKEFINSDLINQDKSYEVELELFNFKKVSEDEDDDAILQKLKVDLADILRNLNNYPVILPNSEKSDVKHIFKKLVTKNFKDIIHYKRTVLDDVDIYHENEALQAQIKNKYNSCTYFKNVIDYDLKTEGLRRNYKDELDKINNKDYPYNLDKTYYVSPKVVSMEMKDIRPESDIILTEYTVTDKADGHGMFLYILGIDHLNSSDKAKFNDLNGNIYLIDSSFNIYGTGLKLNDTSLEYTNTLFNGEFIYNNSSESYNKYTNILSSDESHNNLYMIYDLYIMSGSDKKRLPLMSIDKSEDTRLKNAKSILSSLNLISIMNNEPIDFTDPETYKLNIALKKFLITNVNDSESIFECSKEIWTKFTNGLNRYKYDGLIYTPARLPVGYRKFSEKDLDFDLKINVSWNMNKKWKPEYENTIDFIIKEEKDEIVSYNGSKITKTRLKTKVFEENGYKNYKKYKTFNLEVGKFEENFKFQCKAQLQNYKTTKYNKKNNVYMSTNFIPTTPYSDTIHKANLIIKSDEQNVVYGNKYVRDPGYTGEWVPTKDIIKHDTIVEFAYRNYSKDSPEYIDNPNFRWIPLRTRYDKTIKYKQGIISQKSLFMILQKFLLYADSNKRLNRDDKYQINKLKKIIFSIPIIKSTYRGSYDRYDLYDIILDNIDSIKSYYPDYSHIKAGISIAYGNDFKVANSIWRSIHNPVTEKIITGEDPIPDYIESQDKYYRKDISDKREKSLTIHLQNFHNKVIKNKVLYANSVNYLRGKGIQNINLLDLATGKGGDIPKWKDNLINTVVGVDLVKNNIYDTIDGACIRRLNYLKQKKSPQEFLPDIKFLVGDVSKNILNGNSFNMDSVSTDLWGELWNTKEFGPNYKDNKFNLISIMFALHYMFKNKTSLDNLIQNIDDNLVNGGLFIGACLDGTKIFELLSDKTEGEHVSGKKNKKILWKIKKNYTNKSFDNSEDSLGLEINVLMSSIGQSIPEYLVNFEYFKQLLKEKNIKLLDLETSSAELELIDSPSDSFEKIYTKIETNMRKSKSSRTSKKSELKIYNSIKEMSDDEKKLSFLTRYFIFQKMTKREESENIIYNHIIDPRFREIYSSILGKRKINFEDLKNKVNENMPNLKDGDDDKLWVNIQNKLETDIANGTLDFQIKKTTKSTTSTKSRSSREKLRNKSRKESKSSRHASRRQSNIDKMLKVFNKFYLKILEEIKIENNLELIKNLLNRFFKSFGKLKTEFELPEEESKKFNQFETILIFVNKLLLDTTTSDEDKKIEFDAFIKSLSPIIST